MAETNGLLNRHTRQSVSRVRISSSPQKSLADRSVRDFFVKRDQEMVPLDQAKRLVAEENRGETQKPA